MKIKVLTLALGLLFMGSITTSSIAQVISTPTSITVKKGDDKNKKKNTAKKSAKCDDKCNDKSMKSCKEKRSCCGDSKLKDDSCKDKKADKGVK